MENSDKLKQGLNEAYRKMVEFKKYKKTPLIVSKDGEIVELSADSIDMTNNVY